MSKKLIMACLSVVALAAFALPATASASPELCETVEGVCVKVTGTPKIRAHSVGATVNFVTGGTTLVECTSSEMTGTLTTNSGTEIKGDIESASFSGAEAGGKCRSSFGGATAVDTNIGNGVPWCLSTTGEDKYSVRGNSCTLASRSITFVLTTTNIGTCKYNRTTALTGTYTTHSTGDAILTAAPNATTEFTKEEGSILCPGSGTLEMQFTLETDVAGTSPLYIK